MTATAVFDNIWSLVKDKDGLARWTSVDRPREMLLTKEYSWREGHGPKPIAVFTYQTQDPAGGERSPYVSVYSFSHGYHYGYFGFGELSEITDDRVNEVFGHLVRLGG